jgi:fructokinase
VPARKLRIGVDLGGTKIEAVVLAPNGQIVAKRRVQTPGASYSQIVQAVMQLVEALESEVTAKCSVGIGTPGALVPATGRLKNSNTTCLNGEAVLADLETALGRPIRMANDADCLALSEAHDGAGTTVGTVFGAILGTGVGGGLVIGGQLVRGANAIAGEWGHNPLPWPDAYERPGMPCYCGRRGCIETYLCGAGLRREFLARSGNDIEPARIGILASDGQPAAVAAIDRYADRLARSLATIINTIDPHIIVLGGGLSNLHALYTMVPARWGRWVFSDTVETLLRPAVHGDSSGVRGAARLWS